MSVQTLNILPKIDKLNSLSHDLRLGHCLTKKQLLEFNCISTANYSHCNTVEDIQHFITCPQSNHLRGCQSSNYIWDSQQCVWISQVGKQHYFIEATYINFTNVIDNIAFKTVHNYARQLYCMQVRLSRQPNMPWVHSYALQYWSPIHPTDTCSVYTSIESNAVYRYVMYI